MPPALDFSKQFGNQYIPEDKDQAIVSTPYGMGIVIRTRTDAKTNITMRDIELVDWRQSNSEKGPLKPHMLYTSQKFPSVQPSIGDEVHTQWGRGKVVDIRDDSRKTHVVKLSSWRLAGRSSVNCYLTAKEMEVMKPYRIYDMSVFEKVDYAKDLKKQATKLFTSKKYTEALELYAKAVDAVRYVQHGQDSTNEVRADLIVVMVTCSNNSGTCCLHTKDWDKVEKFGLNALALLDALEEKKDTSRIRKILNNDGVSDSQLFGTWKVKSLLLIAKGQLERHEPSMAIQSLKGAMDAISTYKKEEDSMYRQLLGQEKELRKIHTECTQRIKANKKKEKQRARAMFGGSEEKKDSETKILSSSDLPETQEISDSKSESQSPRSVTAIVDPNNNEKNPVRAQSPKKRVSFADGKSPGDADDDEDAPSFFEEHMEALCIVAGIGLGFLLVNMALRKR